MPYSVEIILIVLFFFIALCYSSVGFGGGTSYLATLTLMGVGSTLIRPTALLCNIIVVAGGTLLYHKAKYISFRKSLPLIAMSIPMAFIGGYWPIEDPLFYLLLGVSLFSAAILLWVRPAYTSAKVSASKSIIGVCIGGSIGLLSGLVSIGGGIFLAPVLHLIKWADAKHIAAMSSFFILVNSIAGLTGRMVQSSFELDYLTTTPLLIAVLIGGQIGSRLSISWLSERMIKRTTATLMLTISIRILWQQVF